MCQGGRGHMENLPSYQSAIGGFAGNGRSEPWNIYLTEGDKARKCQIGL